MSKGLLFVQSPPRNIIQKDVVSSGTVAFTFTDFDVDNYTLLKTDNLVQLNITATKTGSHALMNTTFSVGTLSNFHPSSPVSGLFPYGGNITDIGSFQLQTDGSLTIRTGNNAYIPSGSSFTLSVMYIVN